MRPGPRAGPGRRERPAQSRRRQLVASPAGQEPPPPLRGARTGYARSFTQDQQQTTMNRNCNTIRRSAARRGNVGAWCCACSWPCCCCCSWLRWRSTGPGSTGGPQPASPCRCSRLAGARACSTKTCSVIKRATRLTIASKAEARVDDSRVRNNQRSALVAADRSERPGGHPRRGRRSDPAPPRVAPRACRTTRSRCWPRRTSAASTR